MPAWTINGTALDAAGLRLASGSFHTQGVSTMSLERAADFDATELLAFNAAAVLALDGVPFFQGRIASIPKMGSASDEAQIYEIADAWEGLETTIYQEQWAIGAGSYLFPRFVFGLGLNTLGTAYERITVGAMIGNVLAYAASVGVGITVGTMPTGEIPIPSEMENMSCAEVIRTALKLHPDWIPWIDHSTTPPTFNVTPISSATAVSLAVTAASQLDVIKRDDLLPDSVRIIYEYATTIDDQVYRNATIDKWPLLGPDGGPRVIGATIPLQGLQMQIQKSRIQARTIPTSGAHAQAKSFIIANYPHLAGIDAADFSVNSLTRTLVAEADAHPDPISDQAERLEPDDVDDLPRQLVRGTIEDWMRRKVGKVRIDCQITADAGASEEVKAAIAKGTPSFTVVATNAVTKLYRGISQWVPPEDVPEGIAQATYEAIHAACKYQGSITLVGEDVAATSYHGKKLNLTAGLAAWSTMNAPVHSVDFNVGNGTTKISFGPAPHLSPQDFIEMQHILRFRPVRWWSFEERGSNLLGGENKPSAAGDTVSGYDGPEIRFDPMGSGSGSGGAFFETVVDAGDTYLIGGQIIAAEVDAGVGSIANRLVLDGGSLPSGITAGDKLWLEVTAEAITDEADEIMISGLHVTAAAWGTGASLPASSFPTISAAGTIILEVGRWPATEFIPYAAGGFNLGGCNGNLNIQRF